jgi:hypothetical protein
LKSTMGVQFWASLPTKWASGVHLAHVLQYFARSASSLMLAIALWTLGRFNKRTPSATRPSLLHQDPLACGTMLRVVTNRCSHSRMVWERRASIENKGRAIDTERFCSFAITRRLRGTVNRGTTDLTSTPTLFRAFNARIAYTRMCRLKRSLNPRRLNALRSRVGYF